jgi:BASS family bile acid:Na+ symporter
VTLGLILNTYAKPVVSILRPVMPFVAMICTSMCIGSPLAINRSQILSGQGLRLVAPVLIFHAAAFTLGYWFSNLPSLRYAHFKKYIAYMRISVISYVCSFGNLVSS